MIERETGWIGLPLELVHSREEAEQRSQHWRELATQLTHAEVRVWAWRAPDGSEAYVLYTNNRELTRFRTDWDRPTHELLDDEQIARLRRYDFELQCWQSGYALVHKKSRTLKQASADTEYDPEEWDLVPGAWDHDHCALCWAYICSHADHGFLEAYFSVEGHGTWVCPSCYQQRIAGWSAMPLSLVADSRSVSDANG